MLQEIAPNKVITLDTMTDHNDFKARSTGPSFEARISVPGTTATNEKLSSPISPADSHLASLPNSPQSVEVDQVWFAGKHWDSSVGGFGKDFSIADLDLGGDESDANAWFTQWAAENVRREVSHRWSMDI